MTGKIRESSSVTSVRLTPGSRTPAAPEDTVNCISIQICSWTSGNSPSRTGRSPLVIFDPPHLRNAGDSSWLAKKYGRLPEIGWKEYLAQGLHECWRVLKPQGTFIFKWNEQQIKYGAIEDVFPAKPVIRFSPKEKTIFVVFYKD